MNEQEFKEYEMVFKKTEQSIRILSNLWDTRLNILTVFLKRKNNSGFLFFKQKPALQSELQSLFAQLESVNSREQTVVKIITVGASNGTTILKKASHIDAESTRLLGDQVDVLKNKINFLNEMLKTYQNQEQLHKEILSLEKELISNLNDEKLSLYMKRIELFFAEFNIIQNKYQEFQASKTFFQEIDADLKKVKPLLDKKAPKEYILPSVNSAIVRVFTSNLVAGITIANPLNNPYFWDLMWRTMIAVFIVNFVDYYFNVFTAMTNKANKMLKLTK